MPTWLSITGLKGFSYFLKGIWEAGCTVQICMNESSAIFFEFTHVVWHTDTLLFFACEIVLQTRRRCTKVSRNLWTIYTGVAVWKYAGHFVHARYILDKYIVFFFEINKCKQPDNFSKAPLDSLSHRTHGFVKSLLRISETSATIRLQQKGPQGICWITVEAIMVPLHKPLQLRVGVASSQYA